MGAPGLAPFETWVRTMWDSNEARVWKTPDPGHPAPVMEGLSAVPSGIGIPIAGIVVTFVRENGLTSMLRQGPAYRLVSGRQRPNHLGMTADDGGHEAENVL